jgi:ABC-2 type transport system permease protein
MAGIWRSFRAAAWLGWQIESNWTQPALFALYSIVKPLALSGILVLMFASISRGTFGTPMFAYMYVGNAFYMYVGAVMTGMAFAVIDDRERYLMLKVMYVAPVDMRSYLAGRGVARFVTATSSVIITLIFGVTLLGLSIDLRAVDWLLFAATFALGLVMLAALGLMLAGTVLLLPHQSWAVGEGVAGALFLFSGAIFPIGVLPASLRPVALVMPLTYWLELVRRSFIPAVAKSLPLFPELSNVSLLGLFALITIVLMTAALLTFRACDWIARERGYLDRTSGY